MSTETTLGNITYLYQYQYKLTLNYNNFYLYYGFLVSKFSVPLRINTLYQKKYVFVIHVKGNFT